MIETQQNKRICSSIESTHILDLPQCCPVSHNPQPGSIIEISYRAGDKYLEVASLKEYLGTYRGGKGDVRSMEGMIQLVAKECAEAVGVHVECRAMLNIEPQQKMIITTRHTPET